MSCTRLYDIIKTCVEVIDMIKKKLYILMLSLLITASLTPVSASEKTLQDDGTYHIVSVEKDGTYTILEDCDTYARAKVLYTLRKRSYDNLAITYGSSFLSLEQGVVEFATAKDCTLNITYTNDENGEEGYTNGCYGIDAAFLEYNPGTQKVKFRLSGVTGWADAADVTIYPIEQVPNVSSFTVKNNTLQHQLKSSLATAAYDNILQLGNAPQQLKEGVTYYSYDTHYFYDDYAMMIEDYRNSSFSHAVNANAPYYNYYQYLNHRSTSAYSQKDVDRYLKDTLALRHTITGFYDKDNYIHDVLTQSLLLQAEAAFFQYQNQFGANALMMLSLAENESALGRSYLAYTRNNLFGHAAYDSAVEENASRYASTSGSVYSHALHYLSNAYMNPSQFQFHGGFFGNKAGGMNVSYASDPYWGEKAAQYFYEMDHAMGDRDHNRYALGIVKNTGVSIYKNADKKSDGVYSIKKGYDAALILLEKLENRDGVWYRVQSDPSLDKEQKQQEGSYNFKNSYGFVKAEDVSTVLNSKHIQDKAYVDITFDANGGTFYPNDKKITLQVETGKTPVIQAPVKDHALFSSWDIQLKPAGEPLTYKATYRDVKQIVLTQMPLTTYDLNESLDVSDGRIRVDFADGTSKEVSMTTDMVEGFSSKKTGTKTLKVTYAGCTLNYEIRVSDELTKKQENMQQRAAAVIKLYDGKTDLNEEALQELEQLRKDVTAFPLTPLANEQIRLIDRILQENLKPRYSVIIKDDSHDLQVSGLSMARIQETGFLNTFLPKTIVLKVKDSIDEEQQALAKKVARANGTTVEETFSIEGTDDFSSLKLKQEAVFSIKKPKDSKNKRYHIYYVDGQDVYQIPTEQSKSRIRFTTEKLGSYVLVSANQRSIQEADDIAEVNTIALNGKNYILRYVLLPCLLLALLVCLFLTLFVYRRRHPNLRLKKPWKKAGTEKSQYKKDEDDML